MKKKLVGLFAIVSILGVAGCAQKPTNSSTVASTITSSTTVESKQAQVTAKITIKNDKEVMEEKEVTVLEGTNLMDAMKANFKLEEENGMITSIAGLAQDAKESKYWVYTINGEMAPKGANETVVQKDETIEFTYTDFKKNNN